MKSILPFLKRKYTWYCVKHEKLNHLNYHNVPARNMLNIPALRNEMSLPCKCHWDLVFMVWELPKHIMWIKDQCLQFLPLQTWDYMEVARSRNCSVKEFSHSKSLEKDMLQYLCLQDTPPDLKQHNFFFFNTVKNFWWLFCILWKAKQTSALNFIQGRSNHSSLQGVLGSKLERTNLISKLTRKFWQIFFSNYQWNTALEEVKFAPCQLCADTYTCCRISDDTWPPGWPGLALSLSEELLLGKHCSKSKCW